MQISRKEMEQYARLLVRLGVNLQKGQSLDIKTEPVHREFALVLADVAYEAGAEYVAVEYSDMRLLAIRIRRSSEEALGRLPRYVEELAVERRDERWAAISLVGEEDPSLPSRLDPARLRTVQTAEYRAAEAWRSSMMAMKQQWCVASLPTPAWAQKVFPELGPEEAYARFWQEIRRSIRLDAGDPLAAWEGHLATLEAARSTLEEKRLSALHFFDPAPAPDGKPSTDLTIGLTDQPHWAGGTGGLDTSSDGETPVFLPNIPTEELFTTPHRQRVNGWMRTSRPSFPFRREVSEATFRFEDGLVVEFDAGEGQDVYEQFFAVEGARRLGEVALVDVSSPIYRSGLVFYNTLFDENAACHVAFGRAYPIGFGGAEGLSAAELVEAGVNSSDLHQDVMIGTDTLDVTGRRGDGSEFAIMREGRYTPEMVK